MTTENVTPAPAPAPAAPKAPKIAPRALPEQFKDLNRKTVADVKMNDLVLLYNHGLPQEQQVKKFPNKETALKSVMKTYVIPPAPKAPKVEKPKRTVIEPFTFEVKPGPADLYVLKTVVNKGGRPAVVHEAGKPRYVDVRRGPAHVAVWHTATSGGRFDPAKSAWVAEHVESGKCYAGNSCLQVSRAKGWYPVPEKAPPAPKAPKAPKVVVPSKKKASKAVDAAVPATGNDIGTEAGQRAALKAATGA